MNVLKNILKYFGILLGICFAIIVVTLAGMMIFKFELFGYKYFKADLGNDGLIVVETNNEKFAQYLKDEQGNALSVGEILEKVDKLTINSNNIDVYVKPYIVGSDNGVPHVASYKIVPYIHAQGFARVEEQGGNLVYNVELQEFEPGKLELVVDIKVPSGFVSYGSSYLTVFTPFYNETIYSTLAEDKRSFTSNAGQFSKENKNILENLTINATTGNVTVSDNTTDANNERFAGATIYVKDLNVTTTSGNQRYHRIGIDNISAKTDVGDISFSALTNSAITGKLVKLESNRGLISFSNGIDIGLKGKTNIEPDYDPLNYSEILSERENKTICELRGELCQIKLNSIINTNLEYIGNSDLIEIGSVLYSLVDIHSNNAHIKIGSIFSNSKINLTYNENISNENKSGFRKIDIDYIECSDAFELDTWSGSIKIGTLRNLATENKIDRIVSESGDITIGNLIGNISAETKSGNITINQHNIYSTPNELESEIANNEFGILLSSVKALLKDYKDLLNSATASSDVLYRETIQDLIDSTNERIFSIESKIKNRIDELKASNTIDVYNSKMRNESNIKVSSTSGAIVLSNLVTNLVNTEIKDNGTSSIKIQFKEFNERSDELFSLIKSSRGKVELFMPNNQVYYVYAKVGNIIPSDGLLGTLSVLEAGNCRASIIKSDNPGTQQTIAINDTNTLENTISTFGIKSLLIVENQNGQTYLKETSKFN